MIERVQAELSERFRVRTSFIPNLSVGSKSTVYKAEFLLRTFDEEALRRACDAILKQEAKYFSSYTIGSAYENEGFGATFVFRDVFTSDGKYK